MSDYERIYLQPECCADPDVGRLWCQDDEPETCPDGGKWTPYVLASEYDRLQSEVERLRGRCGELESALRPFAAEAEYIPDDAVDIHLNYMMDGAEVLERAEFTAEHIHTAAQRLRQQADEAEKAGG